MCYSDGELLLLKNNERVIYSVLRRCHIYPTNMDYDDFVQIGRITFLEALKTFPKHLKETNSWEGFIGYAHQKIYWKTLDELRILGRQRNHIDIIESDEMSRIMLSERESFTDRIEVGDCIEQLLPILTEKERLFLLRYFLKDLSISQISVQFGLSRSSLYRIRVSISKKYANQQK